MSKKSSNFAPAFAPKTEGKQKMILERLINQDVVQEQENMTVRGLDHEQVRDCSRRFCTLNKLF